MENEIYAPPKSDLTNENDSNTQLASRWRRLGGSIIDTVILMAAFVPIATFTGHWGELITGDVSVQATIVSFVLGLVIYLDINGHLLIHRGQTIGKYLLKTKIVSVNNETILPFSKYVFLRYMPVAVVSQIPVVGQFVAFFDCLFVFRSDKRCIHDLLAGSKVIVAN